MCFYSGKMIPVVLLSDSSLFLKPTMSSVTEVQNIDQEMCILMTSYPFMDEKFQFDIFSMSHMNTVEFQ